MVVWRICKAKYSQAAFTGTGGLLSAGRWNPAGVPVVYAATSRALAALEFFVHLDPSVPLEELVIVTAELPGSDENVEAVSEAGLPSGWRSLNHPATQTIGEEWMKKQSSLVLRVPSAVLPGEWNVLINTQHKDFMKVRPGRPEPFRFDDRMFRFWGGV